MPNTPFFKSREKCPNIGVEIISFFHMSNARSQDGIKPRSIQNFFSHYEDTVSSPLQPFVIVQICESLVKAGYLMSMSTGGFGGLDNRYLNTSANLSALRHPLLLLMIDCMIYGMPAVYDNYAPSIIPIINWNQNDDPQIGSSFVFNKWCAITALHCISPASSIAIRGVDAKTLEGAIFYVHPNDAVDLAIIRFPTPVFEKYPSVPIPAEQAQILDEVMALGYPNVPGFHPTLAAEAANISARLSSSRGRVASTPSEIFSKSELFLITARVRGGFSGGPVLDPFGQAVGVISREPAADGNPGEGQRYDDLGYGTAIPAAFVVELAEGASNGSILPTDMSHVKFREFE